MLISLLLLASMALAQDSLTVDAPAGPITGHNPTGYPTVREYLGIPYAAAPRFSPPTKLPPFSTPFAAHTFGASCLQAVFGGSLGDSPIVLPPPTSEDEECLSINVWARNGEKGAAVMLWIYGGGFAIGTSETPYYSGKNIVRDQSGVIVVSFNYRVGLFGFPGYEGLGNKQNPGLLDVRAAVEWVKENIAAFGGDPNRITLFGESAGGAATDAYLYFAAEDPIIQGAILQSGTIAIASGGGVAIPGASTPEQRWATLTSSVDCPATPADASLSCVRAVPAKTLQEASNSQNLTFSPTTDEGTIFSDTAARLASGRFAKVPTLVGSNDQEIPGTGLVERLITRVAFTCPAATTATGRARVVPQTWMYRWFGNFPNNQGTVAGAFHGSEISHIFGTYGEATATDAQRAASKFMQSSWVAFAKDPKAGLSGLGWPTFNPRTNSLVRLAYNNQPRATFVNPSTFHRQC